MSISAELWLLPEIPSGIICTLRHGVLSILLALIIGFMVLYYSLLRLYPEISIRASL
jgi:ABC-type amino acid transport system permease subunit